MPELRCRCGREIPPGSCFVRVKGEALCETCLGGRNPYDNPRDYKYLWRGKMVSFDELPPVARPFFVNLKAGG